MVTQNMLKIGLFGGKLTRFVTALDLITCLKQIKQRRLLHTCVPISELLSNISTMALMEFG